MRDTDLLALDMVAAEEGHANGAMGGMQELQYMDNQVRISLLILSTNSLPLFISEAHTANTPVYSKTTSSPAAQRSSR